MPCSLFALRPATAALLFLGGLAPTASAQSASLAFPAGPTLPGTPGEALRARLVAVNAAAIPMALTSGALAPTVELFDGLTVTLPRLDATPVASGAHAWIARDGGPVTASFAAAGGQFSGSIFTPEGAFGLVPTGRVDDAGRPLCVLVEVAPGAAVRCMVPEREPGMVGPGARGFGRGRGSGVEVPAGAGEGGVPPEGASPPPPGACGCGDDGTAIDVLFLYTPQARVGAGGVAALEARVADALAACNAAYVNSQVSVGSGAGRLLVRSAGFEEIAYNEVAPQWIDHLSRLADPADGQIDQAVVRRDAVRADVTCLIVEDARFTGGAAFYALYVRDAAAQVLNWRAMGGGSLTYAHELGHTHGCAHDRGNSSFALFPYAWGHRFNVGPTTYGTVMNTSPAVPIAHFSNPFVSFLGVPTGVGLDQPLPSDNARAIREARFTIASYGDGVGIKDCNGNGVDDAQDIAQGTSLDTNLNCRPDECERRVYVDAGNAGPQDGLTWETAFTDLAAAMVGASLSCNNIAEIWVADGVYTPTKAGEDPNDRFARFDMRAGLAIVGGFQGKSRPGGGEVSPAQRAVDAAGIPVFATVLSGDVGLGGDHTDNSYAVLVADGTGSTAVLDGVVVERGAADFDGGGVFVANASPVFLRCVFRDNTGGGGAAVSVTAAGGFGASPRFEGCVFDQNAALGLGGAVALRDGAAARFEGCRFTANTAQFGGAVGMFNASAEFVACGFALNEAGGNSGAVDAFSSSHVVATDCAFVSNRAGTAGAGGGGAMIVHTLSTAALDGCRFENNQASGTGGAVWVQGSVVTATGCTFSGNSCGDGGGGLSLYGGSDLNISASGFVNNSARFGGGIVVGDSRIVADRVAFTGNDATQFFGGGLDLFNPRNSILTSCAFTGNGASDSGGAVSVAGDTLLMVNCTLAANQATLFGGGVSMFNTTVTVANTVLFGNVAPAAGSPQDAQVTRFSGTLMVNRSCVEGLDGSLGGVGNTGQDPLLADAAMGDVALLPGSPCIDAGSNALVPAGRDLDVLGQVRFVDDASTPDSGVGPAPVVDIGAAEFAVVGVVCARDYNGIDGVNGDDLADYIADFFDSIGLQPGFGQPIAIPGGFAGNATLPFGGFGRPCPGAPDVPQPNPWCAAASAWRDGGFKCSVGQNNDPCAPPNGDDLADYIAVFFNGCP
jgi:hypothetical protein